MDLLLCIQPTSECHGYSTPDVYPWCQTAAGLRRAMLNSQLPSLQPVPHGLHRNTSAQVWATLTRWRTSAGNAQVVCVSKTSTLRCLVLLSLMACASAGSIHCFRTLHWVFAFFLDWVVPASGSFCWEQGAKKRDSLALQVTVSWCRKSLHLFARCYLHPRASSAIALSPSLDKTRRICVSAKC